MNKYVVVDIGGTEIKYGYCDGAETIYGSWLIRQDAAAELMALLEGKSFDYVGISVPGPFDYENGISYMKHKLPSLYGVPLKQMLMRRYPHITVRFLHDGVAFGLGAVAVTGESDFAGVMLGTGLGYVVVKNGVPQVNPQCTPEHPIWNMPYRDAIAEDYVSGTAILAACRKVGCESRSVRQAALAARNGDVRAAAVFEEAGEALGEILSLARVQDGFDKVILGGQISKSFDLMQVGFARRTSLPVQVIPDPQRCPLLGLLFDPAFYSTRLDTVVHFGERYF